MFESLIKSILDKVAGEYIQGLNTENLNIGIFSGDVKIENVSLNPQVIEMLELPLTLRFSKICKLELKVPFKSLGSKPVEVFLDGLYLVVNPKGQSEWTFKDYRALKAKLANIEAFAAECFSKIAAKQNEKNKSESDAGYVQKLTMKIIDNLQITIRNIHVRFEDTISNKFAWGFCLDTIEIYTTNKDGRKSFVDRTDASNKNEPMRKLLTISNAGVYWNSTEQRMISTMAEQHKLKILNGMILRQGETTTQEPVDFLFKISSQISLMMNNKGNFSVPEIKVNLGLDHITLHLQQKQLQQVIEQIEFISKFQTELAIRKKNEKKLDAIEVEKLASIFTKHFGKMLNQEKDKSVACLAQNEREEFEKAVSVLELEVMQDRTRKIVLDIQKAQKIKELEKKKQDEKKGFFGKWFGSSESPSDSQQLVTEDDKAQIEQFINENFGETAIDAPLIVRPPDYVYMIIDFNLAGASIKLSKRVGQEIECLQFTLKHIYGNANMRDNNNEVKISLDSLYLNMIDEFVTNNTQKTVEILRPTQKQDQSALLEFKMISNPLNQQHIDKIIDMKMKSVRFDYNPFMVNRAVSFFDVKVKDDQLKQQAKEKLQEKLEEQQAQFQQSMQNQNVLALNVELESPQIVLPFKPDGSLTNECWVLDLGTLAVKTLESQLQPNLSFEEKALDIYDISLSKIKLSYFPSIEYYNFYITQDQNAINSVKEQKGPSLYHTIEDFSIGVGITIVKAAAQGKLNKPNIKVAGKINQINLKLKPAIYKKLLQMGNCFAVPIQEQKRTRQQTLEEVESEKKQLLKNSMKSGILFKRGNTLKTWEKFNGVLSNGYIYLFANAKDLKPTEYVWVKNSVITKLDESLVGFQNAFNLKNKYADVYFACEKEKAALQWIEVLEQIKSSPTQLFDKNLDDMIEEQERLENQSPSSKLSKENSKKEENFDLVQVEATFELGKVQLSLFDEQKFQHSPFLTFQTNGLTAFYQQKNMKMNVSLGLGGMFLSDFLYKHKDYSLDDFITSNDHEANNQNSELIGINVVILDKGHPEYTNIGLHIDIKFNTLTVNFKPETLAKVLLFIAVEEQQSEFVPTSELLRQLENEVSSSVASPSLSHATSYDDALSQTSKSGPTQLSLQDTESILVEAKIQIREIKVVLVNRRNRLAVNDLSIQNIDLTFQQKSDEMFLSGKLGNLQVRDLTNFPNTIYKEEDWKQVVPQELIGLLQKEGANSLLEVEFRSFQDGSAKIKADNVATFLKVNLNSIHINYIQRPVLRLLDYSLVQLLGPLSSPQLFVDESEVSEEQMIKLKKDQAKAKDPMEPLRKQGKRQVRTMLSNPKGMMMDIVIMNPLITLKPRPESSEYLQIDLGKITVNNEREKSSMRLLDCKVKEEIKEVYNEFFKIKLANMQIRIIKSNGNFVEMTKQFDYNVNIGMAGFFNEYKYIYNNDIKIDTTMYMDNYISPIIFRMSNADYNLIMASLSKNISYDDGCDRFLVHDWELNQQAQVVIQKAQKEEAERQKKEKESSMIQSLNNQQVAYDKEKGGIHFALDMESLSIFALDKEGIPFARVTLGKMRIIQAITDQKMSTYVYAKTLNGSCFRKSGREYIEGSLLGDINVQTRYSLQEISDLTYLVNHSLFKDEEEANQYKKDNNMAQELTGIKYKFLEYDDTTNAKNNMKFQIVFELDMMPNQDKFMDIIVSDFKVQAETGPLMALAGFAAMDDSTIPPPPVLVAQLTKEEEQERQRAVEEIEQYKRQVGGEMKMNISVMNVLICTPCSDGTNVLAIRGVFDIKINFMQAQSIQYIKDLIRNNKCTFQDSYLSNQIGVMAIDLQGLEIFICNVEELKTKKFKKVNKRSVLLPLNMRFTKNDYQFIASEQASLFSSKTLLDVKLDKTSFKISFSDVTLITSTVNLLLEDMNPAGNNDEANPQNKEDTAKQLPKNDKDVVELSEEDKIKKELEKQDDQVVALLQNEAQINQMDISAELQGFQIVIINDINAAYVPVLDFNIFEMNVTMKKNNIQMSVATVISFSAEYYNPRVGLWEPIIEKVGFSIDFIQSELNNIKQLITVELNSSYSNFNLTFSTQFLSILTKTTKTIKKEILPIAQKSRSMSQSQSQEDEERKTESFLEIENVQHVSPYTVKNETGYTIEVQTDLSNVKQAQERTSVHKQIKQQSYTIQLSNFEEKNFQVDHDQEQLGKVQGEETYVFKSKSEQVKVKVLLPGYNLQFTPQVDLDKVRSRRRFCKNEQNKRVMDILTEVKLDEVSSKKVLIVSSPYYFLNTCYKVAIITLFDSQKNQKNVFKLKTDQKVPIPIDLVEGSFCVNFQGDPQLSGRLNFLQLSKNFLGKAEETKIGDTFLILKVVKDPLNEKRIIFSIEPPYRIKNCLPKTIFIQLINHKKVTSVTEEIKCGQTFEFYNCVSRKDAFLKIQIPGHFWSNEAKISKDVIEKLMIKDLNGNLSEISVHQKETNTINHQGCRDFFIYCKGYIINESPYKLQVFSTDVKKQVRLVGGQKQIYQDESLNSNLVLFGQETGDEMSLADSQCGKISKPTNIGGVGNTQIDLYTLNSQGNPVFQTLGINVSLKNVESQQKLFSKVTTITPRFIVVNKTGYSLEIKQQGFDDKITGIDVDARIPLYWYNESEVRFLNLRIIDEEKDWNWSGDLNVLELGTVNFMLRNKNDKFELNFMRTDVRSDDSNIFIVIEKLTDKERPFLIQNLSTKANLVFSDLSITLPPAPQNNENAVADLKNNNKPPIDPAQQYYFSWDHPFEKERKVVSQIQPLNGSFKNLPFIFSPDQIYFQDKIEIKSLNSKKREDSLYLKWSIDIDGFTRIIRFEDSSLEEPITQKEKKELRKKLIKEQEKRRKANEKIEKEMKKAKKEGREITIVKAEDVKLEEEEKPIILSQISVLIKEFGISVVQNHRISEKPKEFLYITMKGLEYIMIAKEECKITQARIQLINIDQNNSYSLVNPVIFTPSKFGLYIKEKNPLFFINFIMEENLLAKNITLYNNLAIEIDPITLKVDDQFISTLFDFLKSVEEAQFDADEKAVNTLKDYLDEPEQIQKFEQTKFKWQVCEIPPTSLPTFINQLILSNIEINLEFKYKPKASEPDLNVVKQVFTALGVALSDINPLIKLNGIKLTNCFESVSGIVSKLTTHFKDQAIREALKAFGSLNIIGNPVGLFENISSGITDLIQKPAEGFVKGPLEGGLGILEGASSLIKNTMAGAFNSVNKITGSLSNGISSLCMDEQYLEQRDKLRSKKPKHIVDGAVQGATSIFSGVANGITGVFLQPFKGAKKGGVTGFFKGVGKGLVGLVVNPISGVLDAASGLTEGIKNTITYGDEKANEQRLRYPRVFYGRDGFYKEFIDLDAGMKVAMQLVSKGKYGNSDFLQTFLISAEGQKKKKDLVLVITYEVIMLFEQAKEKKLWYISTENLKQVQLKENGVHFTTNKVIKKVKENQVCIEVASIPQKQYILNQVNILLYQLEEEKKIEQQDS